MREGHFTLRDMKEETKKTKGSEGRRHEENRLPEVEMGERVERDRNERRKSDRARYRQRERGKHMLYQHCTLIAHAYAHAHAPTPTHSLPDKQQRARSAHHRLVPTQAALTGICKDFAAARYLII